MKVEEWGLRLNKLNADYEQAKENAGKLETYAIDPAQGRQGPQ